MIKTIDDIQWRYARTGEKISLVYLLPGDTLVLSKLQIFHGPQTVAISVKGKRVKILSKPLPDGTIDLDNPLEYPCKSCGAPRHAACTGDNEACVYRVFHEGGML